MPLPTELQRLWGHDKRVEPVPSGTSISSPSPTSTIAPFTIGLDGVKTQTDFLLRCILLGTMGGLALVVLLIRISELAERHVRHLLAMNANRGQQTFFSRNHSTWWPLTKKHLIFAPLFKKRHTKEIRLSSAVNVGTVPTRLQALLLGLYVLSNLAYCAVLDYNVGNKYEILAELRGRSGSLAVANMMPLMILAGRNNPLIPLLHISFDTYNLLHRWMGRIVVVESVVHTAVWTVSQVADADWPSVWMNMKAPFMLWGGVGVVATVLITVLSPGPVRHAFYETFLNIHILLAIAIVVGVYLHCSIVHLPPLPYVQAAIAFWIAERLFRVLRILRYNFSHRRWTRAEVTALPGDACRVTLHLPKHTRIRAGTHAYLRFARINIWESHPFSIAWVDEDPIIASYGPADSSETLDLDARRNPANTSVSFVIHAKTGFTRKLFNFAKARQETGSLSTHALFEGPYGGYHRLDSYGHVVLFAGSSGIAHQIPFVRHLVMGYKDGTVAARRVVLIWAIRELEHIQWVEPWLSTLISASGQEGIFDLRIFVTRVKSGDPKASKSSETTLPVLVGRPDITQVIRDEARQQIGAMCVTVCGPGGLADDVRKATRHVQHLGNIDFIEESFTW